MKPMQLFLTIQSNCHIFFAYHQFFSEWAAAAYLLQLS